MSDFTIIELDTVDSTNNYAMQLIDANKAYNGLTITARTQTGGKGQRGRTWMDNAGDALLMSVIITPKQAIPQQFVFNSSVAVAVATVLQNISGIPGIYIKWPNDIIVNDKKAGGILIENVLRGSTWAYSVIGIGLNINQEVMPEGLPFATSLANVTGKKFNIPGLRDAICRGISDTISGQASEAEIMTRYNHLLYKRGEKQVFRSESGVWEALIVRAHSNGTLELQTEDGRRTCYQHGDIQWEWK